MAATKPPAGGPGRDDISTPGDMSPGVPLHPAMQSLLTATEQAVADHHEAVTSVIDDHLGESHDDLNAAERELGVSLSTTIGSLDNDITEQENNIGRVLDKVVTQQLVDIVGQENQLSIAGVHVG